MRLRHIGLGFVLAVAANPPVGSARAADPAAAPGKPAPGAPAPGKPTGGGKPVPKPGAPAVPSGPAGKAAETAATVAHPLSPAEIEKCAVELTGGDDKLAGDAARALAADGSPKALAPLIQVLAVGSFPRLLPIFLDAVGKFKNPETLPMLVLYSGNRNVKVRVAAVKAVGAIDDERAAGLLHERLGDQEGEVRAAVAEALARRKDSRVVDRLYALLAKNDAGAAAPLGQLAPLDMVPRVAELRGLIADGALATSLGEFLKRPGAPDRLRLDLVRTIGALPGADATTALVEYVASLPEKESPPSKAEAQTLIDQRGAQ